MKHRAVANLDVSDPVGVRIGDGFVGDAFERPVLLEHTEGDVEGFEVVDEVLAELAHMDRPSQAVFVMCWQRDALLACEVDDGAQP